MNIKISVACVMLFCALICGQLPCAAQEIVDGNSQEQSIDPVYTEFFRAAVNTLYFKGMAWWYGILTTLSTIALAVMGIIGFVGPFIHQSYYEAFGGASEAKKSNRKLAFWWSLGGLFVLVGSTVASLSGWQDSYIRYSSLATRWSSIYRSIERLDWQTAEITKDEFDSRFASISHEIDRAEDGEPPVITWYWEMCDKNARRSFGAMSKPPGQHKPSDAAPAVALQTGASN